MEHGSSVTAEQFLRYSSKETTRKAHLCIDLTADPSVVRVRDIVKPEFFETLDRNRRPSFDSLTRSFMILTLVAGTTQGWEVFVLGSAVTAFSYFRH